MMNTVIIWIAIPIAISFLLMLLQRFAKASTIIVLISSAILAGLAFLMPEDLIIRLGSRQFIFADVFPIFGRVISITKANLTLIGGLYMVVFIWNTVARRLKTSQWFNALSILIASMWVLALAVQPFLYAAVIILLIAILSIPLLSPRGSKAGPGVVRYITFQTIAMPMVLLSAWMLSDIETAPSASALILRASVLVLTSFAIWFALIPVHTWVPMVAQESHPWTVSFLLVLMQSSLTIFFVYFLEEYAWLRNLPDLWDILRWAGLVMIVSSSVLLSFQNRLRRVLAYTYLWEMGYALLSIGLAQQGGLNYLQIIFMPRLLGMAGFTYSLSKLEQLEPGFDGKIQNLTGFYHRYPMLSIFLVMSLLSLAGLPILASFPAKHYIMNLLPWSGYAMEVSLSIGSAGLLIIIFRIIYQLISPIPNDTPVISMRTNREAAPIIVFSSIILLLMLIAGLFPGIFSGLFKGILAPFEKIFLLS